MRAWSAERASTCSHAATAASSQESGMSAVATLPAAQNAEDRLLAADVVRRCGIGSGGCGLVRGTLQRIRALRTRTASLSALPARTTPRSTANVSGGTGAAWCDVSMSWEGGGVAGRREGLRLCAHDDQDQAPCSMCVFQTVGLWLCFPDGELVVVFSRPGSYVFLWGEPGWLCFSRRWPCFFHSHA